MKQNTIYSTLYYLNDDQLRFELLVNYSWNRGCPSQHTDYGWTETEYPHAEVEKIEVVGVTYVGMRDWNYSLEDPGDRWAEMTHHAEKLLEDEKEWEALQDFLTTDYYKRKEA